MSGSSQTTETTREPWGPAADPIRNQVIPGISGAMETPMAFNRTLVGMDPLQRTGLEAQAEYAAAGLPAGVEATQEAWRRNLDPMSYIGSGSPIWGGLQGVYGDLSRDLSESVMPNITAGAIGSGAVGGSREALARGVAAGRAMETGQEALAGLAGNVFSQALGAQSQALSQAPMMLNLGLTPGQTQYNLGGIQRAEDQAQASLEDARADFEQMEPWRRYERGAGVLGPLAGLGGTQISMTEQQASPFQMALSAGMMGLGAMGGMGGFGGGAPAPVPMAGNPATVNPYGFTPFTWSGGRKYY